MTGENKGGTWVIQAAEIAGATLNLLGAVGFADASRIMGRTQDEFTRAQIQLQSQADAAARVRATGNLISSQRAALGASGIAGGRTARLIEARSRINASREQRMANQSTAFQEAASRIQRIQNRSAARTRVFGAANDLLMSFIPSPGKGSPGAAGG